MAFSAQTPHNQLLASAFWRAGRRSPSPLGSRNCRTSACRPTHRRLLQRRSKGHAVGSFDTDHP